MKLHNKVGECVTSRQPIADIILQGLAEIPLRGDGGLKHRTELMEYKYDVA